MFLVSTILLVHTLYDKLRQILLFWYCILFQSPPGQKSKIASSKMTDSKDKQGSGDEHSFDITNGTCIKCKENRPILVTGRMCYKCVTKLIHSPVGNPPPGWEIHTYETSNMCPGCDKYMDKSPSDTNEESKTSRCAKCNNEFHPGCLLPWLDEDWNQARICKTCINIYPSSEPYECSVCSKLMDFRFAECEDCGKRFHKNCLLVFEENGGGLCVRCTDDRMAEAV